MSQPVYDDPPAPPCVCVTESRRCDLCGGPANFDDYCHGCGADICDECRVVTVMGSHMPQDHLP